MRTVSIAFGFVAIVFSALAGPIIGANPSAAYHWSGRASTLFGPVALLSFLLLVILTLLLFSAQREGRWRFAVWSGFLLATPWILFRLIVMLWGTSVPPWFHFPRIAGAVVLWLFIVFMWKPAHRRATERIIELASTLLIFSALSGVFVLLLFLRFWWGARHLNDPRPLASVAALPAVNGGPKPRIIWILLDELSFDQVFAHRFPGLKLPAFDALAAQATVFTQVVPEGTQTERVMPALFTGKRIDKIRSSPDGELITHNPETRKWQPFQQHATVFQDALNSGYRPAIDGWYNPYCRLLSSVLLHCDWSNNAVVVDGMMSNGTLGSNTLSLVGALLGNGTLRKVFAFVSMLQPYNLDRSGQVSDYRNLLSAGDRLLKDPSSSFVFIHLPITHPPGIYDRATGQMTTGNASYVDNLALADRYLGHVHDLLMGTGQWDSSTVLVMGDHSWRTSMMWKGAAYWNSEEEHASAGGQYDPRPAYLVKLSGQQTGQKLNAPFHSLNTRGLLDQLFTQHIRTTQDLRQWALQVR